MRLSFSSPSPRSPGLLGLLCFLLMAGAVCAAEDENAVRLYQRGMKLIADGEPEEALERFNTIATKYRRSETCAQALWEAYRIHEHLGDDLPAFESLNRLATEQPGHFEKAHAAQMRVALRLLGRGKDTGRRTLEAQRPSQKVDPEVLAEMFRVIIKNGPQSELGIQAHYYLALALEQQGQKREAREMHEDFAEHFPKHELADDASYQCAYIAYKDWKLMRGDSPHQREAAAVSLAWFIARYPESDKGAQARACLVEVRVAERRELLSLARYYEARGNAKAAAIYYQQIGEKFPEIVVVDDELRGKVEGVSADPKADRVGPTR
ncbi:MAG: outer membrane protein assembly factor BamD [Verrucomicrobiota bacterium]